MNYLSKLIPNYSELIVLFRDILKNDKAFLPTTDQENALKELKIAIFSAPTFRLLWRNKPVTLSVDASHQSIGAVLLQEQLIDYAKRAFSSAEQSLPQIIKEALAEKFRFKEFHSFIYWKKCW